MPGRKWCLLWDLVKAMKEVYLLGMLRLKTQVFHGLFHSYLLRGVINGFRHKCSEPARQRIQREVSSHDNVKLYCSCWSGAARSRRDIGASSL